jgi:GntR family transcriptional regulator/MocR family aminotransferase
MLPVFLSVDPTSTVPLYRQIHNSIRDAIVGGTLQAGMRLPATRTLAGDLRVSRNTVINAIEQLLAEGYVDARVGSGTYVTQPLPDYLTSPLRGDLPRPRARTPLRVSARGQRLRELLTGLSRGEPRAFRPGVPDLEGFPKALWAKMNARTWRRAGAGILSYGDPAGYGPLRNAIARYISGARGVRCDAGQVLVVAGSQQGLYLASHVLLDPNDPAWLEDPGYLGARSALVSAGARVVPVPIDREGLTLPGGAARSPRPRLVYVSPSHQFPLGVTMTLARRLQLLRFAQGCGAWILEDDYDSEYRYTSRPIAALQGLDDGAHVVYIGSFSKVLLPSLRLGYVVVPEQLVDTFTAARSLIDRESPAAEQATLAAFIEEGHFERHIRRMRSLYLTRRDALIEAVQHHLGPLLELEPGDAGLHVVGWLPPGVDDRQASERAAACGVAVAPLSVFCLKPPKRGGLVLSYGAVTAEEIRNAVPRLGKALRELVRKNRRARR